MASADEIDGWNPPIETVDVILPEELNPSCLEAIAGQILRLFWKSPNFKIADLEKEVVKLYYGKFIPKLDDGQTLLDFCKYMQNNGIPIIVEDSVVSFDFDRYETYLWKLLEEKRFGIVRSMYQFPSAVMMPGEVIENQEFSPRLVNSKLSIDVMIAAVLNTSKVFIFLKSMQHPYVITWQHLNYEMNREKEKYTIPVELWSKGLFCAVYDETVKRWYRGKILRFLRGKQKDKVSVYLIDFGAALTASRSDVKLLPKEFADLKQQAITVALRGIQQVENTKEHNSLVAKEVVDEFTAEPDYWLKCWFLPKNDAGVHEVILKDENIAKSKFVTEHLIEKKLAVKISQETVENKELKSNL